MNELFENMKDLISNIDKEIETLKKASMYVVVYTNPKTDLYYALMIRNANQVCKDKGSIHNIMPSPHPSLLLLHDTWDKANSALKSLNSITNGKNEQYHGKIITYLEYLQLYSAEIKNSYKELSVSVLCEKTIDDEQ